MMLINFVNFAEKGIKQNGEPDVATIIKYHPEVMAKFYLLCRKLGMPNEWLFKTPSPDCVISGYRDYAYDQAVKHSPHNFAIALDVQVSPLDAHAAINRAAVLDEQIKWVTAAISPNLFSRAGLYPFQNTIHLDIADDNWIADYHGTRFWVKDPAANPNYTGFNVLNEAMDYARIVSRHG